ncbi:MAG: HEAT repeat domain-containing protein [Marinirhabdus sp.]|nr:HEAT repeat domain-containing protein [Marinirhabdus sp.]
MAFYDLSKQERVARVAQIQHDLLKALQSTMLETVEAYFEDDDLYIRKAAYLGYGRCYSAYPDLRKNAILLLQQLANHSSELVRQTVINAAGEIGIWQFEPVQDFFESGLQDAHHKARNAVIGSLKKMSQKNPEPTLSWAKKYINHSDKEIRRQVCHGIELRGRTHPEDVLPLLELLQFEKTKRVRDTLVHVLGQISYKKGCLSKVLDALRQWKDKTVVKDALLEIIDVHSEKRYAKFTALSQDQVITAIQLQFPELDFSA